jgi:predicted aldo/keto reductase-like oxidoreductase
MNQRRLGRANIDVSVIAIGTNQLRRVPERQAIDTLKRAFELGVNLVNAEPDYEGAYDLIRAALQECERSETIHLSVQAGGPSGAHLERIFEATCEKLDRECLDLFGITSIADQEAFGANVWGKGGLVEFLLRKKAEGRIRAIYASDHGSPEHTKALIEKDVFDALMLAYNPLGFHLHTVRAKTVWQFERPPVPIVDYELEDLPQTGRDLLPLARARDVGVMLMKPLAGGLLTAGKAFPVHRWRDTMPDPPAVTDMLRYLLMNEAVTCLVPGMASVEEVEENVQAGSGDIRLDPDTISRVQARTAALTRVLCSRCGECDDLCSQGLPISYLFRAAYHYLYPSAPFAISTTLQYFKLYPREGCVCDTCPAQTCRCPFGIDIPAELKAIHRKMVELRDRGAVPCADTALEDWATGRPYSFKMLSREIPCELGPREPVTVRLHVRNTGSSTWYQSTGNEQCRVALAVSLDGRPVQLVSLRQNVGPTQDCHFAFDLGKLPPGTHELRMSLFGEDKGPFPESESSAMRQIILVADPAGPELGAGRVAPRPAGGTA